MGGPASPSTAQAATATVALIGRGRRAQAQTLTLANLANLANPVNPGPVVRPARNRANPGPPPAAAAGPGVRPARNRPNPLAATPTKISHSMIPVSPFVSSTGFPRYQDIQEIFRTFRYFR